jgi:hypothetical protein
MKKQTALEWYHTKLAEPTTQAKDVNTIFLLAKAMEKEQIIEAYRDGRTDQQTRVPKFYNRSSAIYYNSTYGS